MEYRENCTVAHLKCPSSAQERLRRLTAPVSPQRGLTLSGNRPAELPRAAQPFVSELNWMRMGEQSVMRPQRRMQPVMPMPGAVVAPPVFSYQQPHFPGQVCAPPALFFVYTL